MKKFSVLRLVALLVLSCVLLTLFCGWIGAGTQLREEGIYYITVRVEGGTGTFYADYDFMLVGFTVNLIAKPDPGYEIIDIRTEPEIDFKNSSKNSFNMPDSDVEITYILAPINYAITTTVEGNGKVTGAASGDFGSTVTLQAQPDAGWEFLEWQDLNQNLSGPDLSAAQLSCAVPAGNVSLKAVFEQSGHAVAVETAGNGSASASPAFAKAGDTVRLSEKADSGWRFTGWTVLSPQNVNIAGNAFTMPDSPVRLRADFSKLYEIEVKAGDGGAARASAAEGVESEWISVQAQAEEGYAFLRWEVTKGAAPGLDAPSAATGFAMPDCDVCLRAVFQREEDGTEPPTEEVRYTVQVEAQGKGSASAGAASAREGERVELSASADDGWQFSRWNVLQGDAVLQNPVQSRTAFSMPARPVTLQAVFLPEDAQSPVCLISFDSQGGTAVSMQAVPYGSLAAWPEQPVRTGYVFAGWYRDAAGSTPWRFEWDQVFSDVTLYAGWTQNSPGSAVVSGLLRGGRGGVSRPDAGTASKQAAISTPDRRLLAEPVISRLKEEAEKAGEGVPLVLRVFDVRRVDELVLRQILQSLEQGRTVYFQANTTVGDEMQGRVTLELSLLEEWEGDLQLGVYTRTAGTQTMKSWMESYFENTVEVVRLEQQGDLGLPFQIMARVDSAALNSDSLVFYAYDREANRCTRLYDVGYTWDEDGFLHFQTELGGDIILTDYPLTAK